MKRAWVRLIALMLAVILVLPGCGFTKYLDSSSGYYDYQDMVYTRPDMAQLQQCLLDAVSLSQTAEDVEQVVEGIWDFYDAYDSFWTNYSLAYIRYSGDLTDIYWEEEYNYCAEQGSQAQAALDELFYALADSSFREELEGEEYFGQDYFDSYEGESIWDEGFLALMEQEAELVNRYYDLSEAALETEYYSEEYFTVYGTQMAQLFVELVALRQEIAAYVGYDSYPVFAYDFYYYRDYTPEQALSYCEAIGRELAALYRQVNASNIWDASYGSCSERETFAYVSDCADAMGGIVSEAFQVLDHAGVYDISYGENKFDTSFEIYLDSYYIPFIFMNPELTQYDKLTFAHEFGHFVNDYACGGSYTGIDVAEVFSQAMEYLSLRYTEGAEDLERFKLADGLATQIEQGAYTVFETRVYALEGEELTVENVQALYEQVGLEFGFDSLQWDPRDYVTVPHFFTDPLYIISYVVSNDVALQIYELELAQEGEGLKLLQNAVYSSDSFIIAFAESYGLRSPFSDSRVKALRQTMETMLN